MTDQNNAQISPPPDPRNFYFPPPDAAYIARQEIIKRSELGLNIFWGVPAVDKYLVPMGSGDVTAYITEPGMGKTTTCIYLARQAERMFLTRPGDKRMVGYVSYETTTPEFVSLVTSNISRQSLRSIALGEADMKAVEHGFSSFVKGRIAVIGRNKDKSQIGVNTIPNIFDLDRILQFMVDIGTPVGFLIIDYLQQMPALDPRRDRTYAVSENTSLIKELAGKYDIPIFLPTQARREVQDYKGWKLPGLRDAQWTSTIEQACDKLLSATLCKYHMNIGEYYDHPVGDKIYKVQCTAYSYLMKVLKCRWGPSGAVFPMSCNWAYQDIKEDTLIDPAF